MATEVSDKLKAFHEELDRVNLGPLWAGIHQLVTKEPVVKAVPYLWKKELIEDKLAKAEQLLSLPDAERRAVFLINPGVKEI